MVEQPLAPYKKEKIGSHLSYPLNFSEVVSGLEPALERLSIKVWFWAWRAPRLNHAYDLFPVLSAEYWIPGPHRSQAEWWLFVRPIPRSLRSQVRSLLLGEGLDRLRTWYSLAHTPLWLSAQQKLGVSFVVASEKLEYDRAYHDRAEDKRVASLFG